MEESSSHYLLHRVSNSPNFLFTSCYGFPPSLSLSIATIITPTISNSLLQQLSKLFSLEVFLLELLYFDGTMKLEIKLVYVFGLWNIQPRSLTKSGLANKPKQQRSRTNIIVWILECCGESQDFVSRTMLIQRQLSWATV